MRKTWFIVLLIYLVSAIPSYAIKYTVNDEMDRTVPSRSTSPEERIQYWSYTTDYYYDQNPNEYYLRHDYNKMMLLGENVRPELVGVVWYYPKEKITPVNVNAKQEQTEQIIMEPKRYSREAADYYSVDTNVDPDMKVPSGYVIRQVQEL